MIRNTNLKKKKKGFFERFNYNQLIFLATLVVVLLYAGIYIYMTADAREIIDDTTTTSVTTTIQESTTETTTEIFTSTSSITEYQTTEVKTVPTTINGDVYLLAQLIQAEADDECSDEHKLWVGQVALNRIKHPGFENTLKDVIYEPGQYPSAESGAINNIPSHRSLTAAKTLLDGLVLDDEAIWQSNFPQGEVIKVFHTRYGTTYIGK